MSSSLTVIPFHHHNHNHSNPAKTTKTTTTSNSMSMDRMDAARALLGVSPRSSCEASSISPPNTSRLCTSSTVPILHPRHTHTTTTSSASKPPMFFTSTPLVPQGVQAQQHRTMSLAYPGSNALDALAALASREHEQPTASTTTTTTTTTRSTTTTANLVSASNTATTSSNSSSDTDDAQSMPPPPPRFATDQQKQQQQQQQQQKSSSGRRWNNNNNNNNNNMQTRMGGRRRAQSNPEGMEKWAPMPRKHFVLPASILEEELAEASAAMEEQKQQRQQQQEETLWEEEEDDEEADKDEYPTAAPISGLMSQEEQLNLTPDELLQRTRSRLLEDLSEGSVNGEKGVLTLPHSLSKYKDVYNRNGRIGIYTPAERSAIIARFQSKRARRVWNKKIRYNCRKNLADRRLRVKGRFVKRSEQPPILEEVAFTDDQPVKPEDDDMPDIHDPDAGFCPTDDQPYRRTRRHTIT